MHWQRCHPEAASRGKRAAEIAARDLFFRNVVIPKRITARDLLLASGPGLTRRRRVDPPSVSVSETWGFSSFRPQENSSDERQRRQEQFQMTWTGGAFDVSTATAVEGAAPFGF
jgi:hypothetical protein